MVQQQCCPGSDHSFNVSATSTSPESFDCQHAHVLERYMVLITRVDPISYGTVLLQMRILKPRVERAAQAILEFGRAKKKSG